MLLETKKKFKMHVNFKRIQKSTNERVKAHNNPFVIKVRVDKSKSGAQ